MQRPPTCAEARPKTCPCCGAAAQPIGAPLVIVGHGVRLRQALGPVVFGGRPEALDVPVRRYRCRACSAVLVVGPRGLLPGRSYSAPAVASALAAVANGKTSAAARKDTSPSKQIGASAAERWITLVRWLDAAQARTLFAVSGLGGLDRRRVAEQVTLALAARGGHVPGAVLGASAFVGAAQVA